MSNQMYQVNCKSCNGVFVTENAQVAPLLRCPHCRTEAPPRQFNYMPMNEPFQVAQQQGLPALFSAIEHADDGADETLAEKTATFRLRGKWMHFDCPHCQWPLRIKASDAQSSLIDCGHCGLEILPPDPESGTSAQLTRASAEQLKRMAGADMRSVRLGKSPASGKSITARAAKEQAPNPDSTEILRSEKKPKTQPLSEKPASKRSVKPLAPEQLGRSFKPFENETILGGPAFELTERDQPDPEKRSRLNHAKIFRYVMITGLVLLSAVAVLMQMRLKDEKEAAIASAAETQKRIALAEAESARQQAMFDTARQLAAAPDWRAFLPTVRQRSRVEPLMEKFYAEQPHEPVELVRFDKPIAIDIDGRKYEQMNVETADGDHRVIGFQHDPDGLKFDWEVFVDVAAWEWAHFKAERPTDFRNVRVVVMRMSADDRYFRDANLTRDTGMAVRIWLRDRSDSLVAMMEKGSVIAQQVEHECKWEIGKLVIADLAFPTEAETRLPDRVILRRIVQDRWLLSDSQSGE